MRIVAQFLLCCLLALPAAAQRGGGMRGSGMRGGFGGFRGGFGSGFRGGFVGSGFGGFGGFFPHHGFHHGFFFPRHRFFFGAGFGFLPFASPIDTPIYPHPYYGTGYSSSYYGTGYSPSPAVVIYQSAPAQTAYSAPPPPSQSVRPEISEDPETSQSQKYEPPIYLIAFKNHENIRAAQAYWVEGDTLQYITLQHEHKQAPLNSVDRAFTYQLNRERHVDFRLPSE